MRNVLIILFITCAWSTTAIGQDKVFSFVAIGDMPYFLPDDYARFENVIKSVNQQDSKFTVHVGDFKSSSTPCTDEAFQKILGYFSQFTKPLIYTPGDNEWTDCNKKEAGSYVPEERLEALRKMFFKDSNSLGLEKLPLTSQARMPGFAKFVENNRWVYQNIDFATVHLVGTNNNLVPENKASVNEYFERDLANEAWLHEVFSQATASGAAALVLFTQADMFNADKGNAGFTRVLRTLRQLTLEFGKPVLLINGDSHKFLVDKPFLLGQTKKVMPNFTRIQVFGEQDMHGVKVTVLPGAPVRFQIEQLFVNGN